MVRPNKNTEGDNRLKEIADALRSRKRKMALNIPRYRQLVVETWETIMLFSKKDEEISIELIYKMLRIRKEYVDAALFALEKAGKIEHNKEKKTVKVTYK